MGFLETKKKKEDRRTRDNGRLLLEELIASFDGKCNPIRTFSSDQILKATNNFDKNQMVGADRFIWYRGMMGDRCVLIKKWVEDLVALDNIYLDIAVSSLMSSHKNALKLLGCCLEFRHPVLVCEDAGEGSCTLRDVVNRKRTPLPWNIRLKIAKEIAYAVTYLHTAFPRIIIHRDIKPSNIFLDENWTAKLSSFCLSISIPEGETSVFDDKLVSYGLDARTIDPDYFRTGFVSEGFDVYSFGYTMLYLLAGELGLHWLDGLIGEFGFPFPDHVGELVGIDQFMELIDPAMVNGGTEVSEPQRQQIEVFVIIVLRCVRFWPTEVALKMIDVAKELKLIEASTKVSMPQ